jgi:metal-responsive CopG/Arc/MetJ family transcriptional regulator
MRTVNVRLNQQQLELLDATVSKLGVDSRAELLRQALREYAGDSQRAVATSNGTKAEDR